ncbi:uncharacterized protein LOC135107526 isoform X1 [Scylla paramamosain]|uniref:uncharacterized protein LOC135107526 isoform X1 n=1 Tax=Scylla paramamosain TaxID=85552 RepID=UPI003082B872
MEKATMTLTIGKLINAVTFCLAIGSGKVHSRGLPTGCSEAGCSGVECYQGFCGAQCECECLPCFTGPSCASYEDLYGPRFAIREDTVILEPHHTGVVYKAAAEDEDLGLTCPLGPGRNSRCPCASIRYEIFTPGRGQRTPHSLFTIHPSSGQVFLQPGTTLQPSVRHQALVVASSINGSREEGHLPLYDVQTLTVMVRHKDSLRDLLQDPLLDQLRHHFVQDVFFGTNFTKENSDSTHEHHDHHHQKESNHHQNSLAGHTSHATTLSFRRGGDLTPWEKQVTKNNLKHSVEKETTHNYASRDLRVCVGRPSRTALML